MSQEVSEPCTDWTPSRSRDCLDPQKSLTSLACLEHSSESRIRQSRDSPLQPKTQPVRAHLMCNNSQLFQTWQTYPQLALAIEGGHNSACHILNCSPYILGEKKAEISHSLQFSLGHSAVRVQEPWARKGAGKRVNIGAGTHAGIWKEL